VRPGRGGPGGASPGAASPATPFGRSGSAEEAAYLRHVITKFASTRDGATQERLLPVLAALLHFTPTEAARVNAARAATAPAPAPAGIAALFPLPFSSPFK
jgi:hypothetical protein